MKAVDLENNANKTQSIGLVPDSDQGQVNKKLQTSTGITSNTSAQIKMSPLYTPDLQMKCAECEAEEEEKLQMKPEADGKTIAGGAGDSGISNQIQAKLEIGAPDDKYEREADTVADMVMRMPASNSLQMKCEECQSEEKSNVYPPIHAADDNTIQRAVQEQDIENGVQQFSTHCGWLDWPHADPLNSMHIIQEVRSAHTGHRFTARWNGSLHSASLEVEILSDLANAGADLQNSVSLGIFQALSYLFEASQIDVEVISDMIPILGYRSSFSVEDLPSNLIGFYRAINGLSQEDVCRACWCWDRQSSLDRFNSDNESGVLEPENYTFRASEYGRGGQWPAEFSSIQPSTEGIHWRAVDRQIRNTFTLGRTIGRGVLNNTRPTMPVMF